VQKGKGAVLTLGYGLAAPLAFEGDEGNGNAVSHSQVRPDNRLFIMRHPVANGPNNPNRKQASKQKSNKVVSFGSNAKVTDGRQPPMKCEFRPDPNGGFVFARLSRSRQENPERS
jgi:hypothetical protein